MAAAGSARGPYLHLTPAQKFQIGKKASKYGVTKTLDHYKVIYRDLPLKETSVRRFKDSYRALLKKRIKTDELMELPSKKTGRP